MVTFQPILCRKKYMISKSNTAIPIEAMYNQESLVSTDTDNLN